MTSTYLKLTEYTLEQHTLRCPRFYYVKFEHVDVYRDNISGRLKVITKGSLLLVVPLKSFVVTFSKSFIHTTVIYTLRQLLNQLYFYDINN